MVRVHSSRVGWRTAERAGGLVFCLIVVLSWPAAAGGQAASPGSAEQLAAVRQAASDAQRFKAEGKLPEAIEAERRAFEIARRLLGDQHPGLIGPLEFIASCHEALSQWPEAKVMRQAILRRATAAYDRDDYRTVDARLAVENVEFRARLTPAEQAQRSEAARLNSQMIALYGEGKYDKAAPLAEHVCELRRKLLGETHPDYAASLNNLAMLYTSAGDYIRAEPLYRQAIDIQKQVLGETHPHYATGLNNLALLQQRMGDYSAAEPLYQQAMEIDKKTLGETHPAYANDLNNVAGLYKTMGDYARAEPLYQRALEIRKHILGEADPDYAMSLSNLALLYDYMGDCARAEPLYQQALEIRKKALGETHPDYAQTLNNLALLYGYMGDYARAEPLCQQALEIRKQVFGEGHPDYAQSLNNLAVLYQSEGDYARAEPLFRQALAIRKQTLGQAHPEYAQTLNNLAVIYKHQGDYLRAEPLYQQATQAFKQALGETHLDYATSLNNLAALYESMRDYPRAEPLFRQAVLISLANLQRTFAGQSERQQVALVAAVRYLLDNYLSLVARGHGDVAQAYAIWLEWKGLVLRQQQQLHGMADRPELKLQFDQLKQVTARLARLALATAPQGQQAAAQRHASELSSEKERIEQELAQRSAEFRASLHRPTNHELQQALPPMSVLVDFIEYWQDNVGHGPGTKPARQRRLAAFIVPPQGEIKLVSLGENAAVNRAIDVWRGQDDLDFGRSPAARAAGYLLRERIWQPIAEHLAGARLVLLSPEGALGKLPFAALPGAKPDSYLLEDVSLVVIPSPAALTQPPHAAAVRTSRNLLIVADVDYDRLPSAPPAAKKQFLIAQRGPARDDADKPWPHLNGTLGELGALKLLYEKNFGSEGLQTLDGAGASEESLRAQAPQYLYLHLATHGFFSAHRFRSALDADLSDRGAPGRELVTRQNLSGYHPGLLSGLVLAGANHPQPGGDDGYLTAEEVATLDLRGVELCVLSACETGLGEVAGGEGLLGLQRAFQLAGSHAVVASLWRVPDQATRHLMERFYSNLWGREPRMTKIEALRDAQLWMLREGASRGLEAEADAAGRKRLAPYYWAAFVLSGDWY
jgi:CHAT domain-containing protein